MPRASVQAPTELAGLQGHENHCDTISNCERNDGASCSQICGRLCFESDHHSQLPKTLKAVENVGNGVRIGDALETNELTRHLLSCSRKNWQRKGRTSTFIELPGPKHSGYQVLDIDYLAYASQPACKVHIILSILHPRKGKLRAVKSPVQGHTPNKQQSQG